ncbi:hypothetical protein [Actinopolyspora mortivallis]|uniref:Glycosyl hydrolase family 32 N-terminal domain-containing protein n=1 Tax=Actinopolyspora mortivallis TaxID=33906 RepID=A0A2T0GRW0_ACTMO|nr:hypothetical protein [Actinopolyspora mortivallis]PRW61846.1 hypothetical protein CEP50_18595 [Actinopolyspora mortivallis]
MTKHNGKLYCVYKGTGQDTNLYYSTTDDGYSWTMGKKIDNGTTTNTGVGLARYKSPQDESQKQLVCLHTNT